MTDYVPGKIFDDRWMLEEIIGGGGSGEVWRVRDLTGEIADACALKIFTNTANRQRYERERLLLLRARGNPLVVQLLDYGNSPQLYLVMELATGGSLSSYCTRHRVSPEQALWIMAQTSAALAALGVVHRDVKPENFLIFLKPDQTKPVFIVGDRARSSEIKIADMGLAKAECDHTITMTGHVMGTPEYMSPEQCMNTKSVTPASDVYSLGVMLYELVIGHAPFPYRPPQSSCMEVFHKQCYETVFIPRYVPRKISTILERSLEKSPGKRYATPADFGNACLRALGLPATISGSLQWQDIELSL